MDIKPPLPPEVQPGSKAATRLKRLCPSIAKLGFACPGSITRRYKPCKKLECRCATGREYWHGPYYQWTRKIDGKTATFRLSPDQAQILEPFVQNDRRLQKLLAKMRAVSMEAFLQAISR